MAMCGKLGLMGQDTMQFITKQQEQEREERARAREETKLKLEMEDREKQRQFEEKQRLQEQQEREKQRQLELEREDRQRRHELEEHERQREHELAMQQLKLQELEKGGAMLAAGTGSSARRPKTPMLPSFVDGKDDLDSYLQRFERYATTDGWDRDDWAVSLGVLLTGRALEVYSRLPPEAAADYDLLKEALLKRYNLSEDGYRQKFRKASPEEGESSEQFLERLKNYMHRWVEQGKVEKSYEGVCQLAVKDQFMSICSKDMAVHLREKAPRDLKELGSYADRYLIAHETELRSEIGVLPLSVVGLLATVYYFGFFMVIAPWLSRNEQADPLPASIHEAVMAEKG